MKTAFQILLTVAILFLGYLCVESINKPMRFQREHALRQQKVIERLIEIRTAEVAYRSVYGKYTGDFDTLITFIKTDSLPMVRMEGSLTDSMIVAGMTETMALAQGIIRRDTTRISARDSLYRGRIAYIDSLRYVPFSENRKIFELGIASLQTASGVAVGVFEAKTPNNVFLWDLDKQEVINLNDMARKVDKYPGLKVGSLEEANNNAGNWE
ncbi:MAG: hypothetical protein LBV41_02140 [Cytophagaceae bacterium]|jgi:hypothetical protein|nr:hypothetical protein [Cytophagaceae bacterium]